MTNYPKLSKTPLAAEYEALKWKKARLGRFIVEVQRHTRHSKSGSWERGFKFSDTTYGVLVRKNSEGHNLFSANHGATWHETFKDACRAKGKVVLERYRRGELAFEGIQQINRSYFGPGYKWRP